MDETFFIWYALKRKTWIKKENLVDYIMSRDSNNNDCHFCAALPVKFKPNLYVKLIRVVDECVPFQSWLLVELFVS